ncbi:MAG: TonB-dependent receptor [Xanthomonadales bacterium]|nr:TonB-dependent receptor [Gammaproteobacteria bacterium]MBT8055171.1 TonB-dependent receptor [Gammaproteobacteria bacterium]NND57718.1 TonB-dependent receptor [Xanthomonadales bacterium]NNK52843.1 TonB-dependent receptor [Xanthomonadales bacterium]
MRKLSKATIASLAALAFVFAAPVFAQTDADQDDAATDQDMGEIEEVVVTGSQIRGAAINDALSVSVIDAQDIESMGFESGGELLQAMPEQGQNFFNDAENISGGVNSARGDIGAFNLRNIGTGNTLVLMNGRRVVNAATYQTEEVGGSFVPVNSANSSVIPLFGVQRVEVLRDGASAIYGADAVAGVVNTVMRNNFEGFTIRGRWTSYDKIPRDTGTAVIEWGDLFNEGRTRVGVFASYYQRDRVNSQDDPKWADSDYRRLVPEDSPWFGNTAFRNNSANSLWGQYDLIRSMRGDPFGLVGRGIVDGSGEFETYPVDDPRCEGGYNIAENVCGNRDGQGTYRYNLNDNRDVSSRLKRWNIYSYLNHEFDNGIEAYGELQWYEAKTNMFRHPSASFTSVRLRVAADNYYNPLGPCGSPNRLPEEVIGPDVPCEGLQMSLDNYRFAEYPRIVDVKGTMVRILGGLRGTFGADWDWDSAVLYSKAKNNETTHNRVSNNLMQEALNDPTSAAYNAFGGGGPTNVERALVDVYRNSKTDLKLIDFKISKAELFNVWGGPVGFLAGAEYRKESFNDDRDPRLDGTITFTDWEGDTYPFVSDVVNSSPTPDNSGSRNVTSLFGELAVPLFDTLDLQLALRYEDFSDVGNTMVPKIAFGWRPLEWFMLRGSWSEAFRAPNLITVNEELVVRNNTRTDYTCQYAADFGGDPDQDTLDCRNNIQRRATGSKDLKPEKSDNTSLGIVLTPLDNLTLTLDFWRIKKKDTIGLFGEENQTLLDLLTRIEAGTGSCGGVEGNPALGRSDIDENEIPFYLAAGICPAGPLDFVNDRYQNLNTRKVEGYDFGVYYDLYTDIGDWSFSWQGSVYTRYDQEPGGAAQVLLDAQNAGTIPANYPVSGFDDLLRMDGNQEKKMNARLRWRKGGWGASVAWFYLSDFYQSSLTLSDGSQWVIPSHDYWNVSADYRFDLWSSESRVRLGINNVSNERAPLADRYFGYFSDAHRDYGRAYYVDLMMSW